jgi:hypothetical protein
MTCRNFQVFRVLESILRMKHRQTPAVQVGKILSVEKRRERLPGACRWIQKPVVPWVRLEIGFL